MYINSDLETNHQERHLLINRYIITINCGFETNHPRLKLDTFCAVLPSIIQSLFKACFKNMIAICGEALCKQQHQSSRHYKSLTFTIYSVFCNSSCVVCATICSEKERSLRWSCFQNFQSLFHYENIARSVIDLFSCYSNPVTCYNFETVLCNREGRETPPKWLSKCGKLISVNAIIFNQLGSTRHRHFCGCGSSSCCEIQEPIKYQFTKPLQCYV